MCPMGQSRYCMLQTLSDRLLPTSLLCAGSFSIDAFLCIQDHPISNVWAVGAPYILLYYIVSRFLWQQLSSTMYISLAPWDIWPFLW